MFFYTMFFIRKSHSHIYNIGVLRIITYVPTLLCPVEFKFFLRTSIENAKNLQNMKRKFLTSKFFRRQIIHEKIIGF